MQGPRTLPLTDGGFALTTVVLLLGLRHGLDADHLATIDGLTRLNSRARRAFARYCGVLFSLGHGAVVTAIALLLSGSVRRWPLPGWLDVGGTALSVLYLLLLAGLNLQAAIGPPSARSAALGLKLRALGPLALAQRAWSVALVGALFALSFDTLSLAALFAVSAARLGGGCLAALLGVVFTLGMLVTDGLNGWWIARLIRRSDRHADRAGRFMSLAVAAASLLVAAFGIVRVGLPRAAAWMDGKGLLLAALVLGVVLAGFRLGRHTAPTAGWSAPSGSDRTRAPRRGPR